MAPALQAVARALGIDQVHAQLLPDDKVRIIGDLRSRGAVVAMVGDGINDAPSLVAADVGLAVSTGADVAMEAAGITLMRGDPRLVADALGMTKVLVHPFSGLLSAYGMGLASVRAQRTRAVGAELTPDLLSSLLEIKDDLAAETGAELAGQGGPTRKGRS